MSLGPSEIVVVVLVALVVLGPDKLPQAVRTITKYLAEFRKFSAAVQAQVDEALRAEPEAEKPAGPTPPADPAKADVDDEAMEAEARRAEAAEKPDNPDVSGFSLIEEKPPTKKPEAE